MKNAREKLFISMCKKTMLINDILWDVKEKKNYKKCAHSFEWENVAKDEIGGTIELSTWDDGNYIIDYMNK